MSAKQAFQRALNMPHMFSNDDIRQLARDGLTLTTEVTKLQREIASLKKQLGKK